MMSWSYETLQSQYEVFDLLGEGSYSKVLAARHRLTGVNVAIKVLEKQEARFLTVAEEVEILQVTRHPNIVSLFQIFETEEKICLVLELCQTELQQHIYRKGYLQEDEARGVFRQVLNGMCHCHSQGIAHLDIKPDNIMLDERGKAVIIDFGLATRFLPGQKLTKYCGAYIYMSPEVMRSLPYDGPRKDMWSLGVILYFMVTGSRPFKWRTFWELRRNVISGNYTVPENLSTDLKSLIRQLLSVDPKQRPTVMDVLKHPWLQQGQGKSGGHELLPRQLDTDILSVMDFMHFDLQKTVQSIQHRKFNSLLATYHLLQYQAQSRRADRAEEKPGCPGTAPYPTPTYPADFALPPRRKHRIPATRSLSSHFQAQEQAEDGQQAEHETFWSASLPSLRQSRLKKRPAVTPSLRCLHPVSAPGPLCPRSGSQLLKKASPQMREEQPASTRGSHGQGSRPELPEKMATLEGISEVDTETSSRGLHGRWKAFRGSIQSSLRRFHRRPSWNFRLFRKRVFPSDSSGVRWRL